MNLQFRSGNADTAVHHSKRTPTTLFTVHTTDVTSLPTAAKMKFALVIFSCRSHFLSQEQRSSRLSHSFRSPAICLLVTVHQLSLDYKLFIFPNSQTTGHYCHQAFATIFSFRCFAFPRGFDSSMQFASVA